MQQRFFTFIFSYIIERFIKMLVLYFLWSFSWPPPPWWLRIDLHLNSIHHSPFVPFSLFSGSIRWKHSVTCTDPRQRWSWRKWRRLPEARISHCNNSTATEAVSLTWWQAEAEVAEVVDPEWRPNGWRHSGRWPTVRLRKMCRHLVRLRQQPDRVRHSAIQSRLTSNYVIVIVVLVIIPFSFWFWYFIISFGEKTFCL